MSSYCSKDSVGIRIRGCLGSIPTGGNILSLDFFHVVKPLMPILPILSICENPPKKYCILKGCNSCSDDIHWSNCFRYLELVHPIWHRTHFKMRYIYMAIAFVWIFGLGLNAAHMIPTGKVILIYLYKSSLLFEWK